MGEPARALTIPGHAANKESPAMSTGALTTGLRHARGEG